MAAIPHPVQAPATTEGGGARRIWRVLLAMAVLADVYLTALFVTALVALDGLGSLFTGPEPPSLLDRIARSRDAADLVVLAAMWAVFLTSIVLGVALAADWRWTRRVLSAWTAAVAFFALVMMLAADAGEGRLALTGLAVIVAYLLLVRWAARRTEPRSAG